MLHRVIRVLGAFVAAFALLTTAAQGALWDQENLAPPDSVEGYTSQSSVRPGQTLDFHISTARRAAYRLEIYRLGAWRGKAPRRLLCLPSCRRAKIGRPRPTPPVDPQTGRLDAGWPVTDRLRIPSGWPSGYYVAKAVFARGRARGTGRFIPFIVREPVTRRAPILVQTSTSTWQAYNNWGGKSTYDQGSTGAPATHVSFNRPYALVGTGGQSLFDWELQLARFLERQKYDVSYVTGADVHYDPTLLAGRRLVISSGHDEYWSHEQRSAFERARDSGTNLAFFGANTAYWQVRYEDRGRTIVSYKDHAPDPIADRALHTKLFRHVARPECLLLGVQRKTGALGGPFDYTVNDAALNHPWFGRTGFAPGSVLRGAVGYEWDAIDEGCVDGVTVLFQFPGQGRFPPAHMVTYTAPSGATVFSAGTFQLSWFLDNYGHDPDRRVQRFVGNMLDTLGR